MAKPRRSRRPRTTLIVLVLVSVSIITLDARGGLHRVTSGLRSVADDAFSPVQGTVDGIVRPVGSFLAGSVHYGSVRQQNQKLESEIGQLRRQLESEGDDEQSLRQLSALSNLPFVANLETVPAEVTDYNTSDFAATVDIDMGRADGVAVGMPVVGSDGLVGQVVEAAHGTATVRLLSDGQSSVGAHYGATATAAGSLAVVSGNGWSRPLSADLVPPNTPLPPGTVFVTSGLDGAAYPPGIPVASVVRAQTGSAASQESVSLQPVADLAQLRYVSVVLWGPGTS